MSCVTAIVNSVRTMASGTSQSQRTWRTAMVCTSPGELYYLRHLRSIAAAALGAHGGGTTASAAQSTTQCASLLAALAAGVLHVAFCVAWYAVQAGLFCEMTWHIEVPCSFTVAAAIVTRRPVHVLAWHGFVQALAERSLGSACLVLLMLVRGVHFEAWACNLASVCATAVLMPPGMTVAGLMALIVAFCCPAFPKRKTPGEDDAATCASCGEACGKQRYCKRCRPNWRCQCAFNCWHHGNGVRCKEVIEEDVCVRRCSDGSSKKVCARCSARHCPCKRPECPGHAGRACGNKKQGGGECNACVRAAKEAKAQQRKTPTCACPGCTRSDGTKHDGPCKSHAQTNAEFSGYCRPCHNQWRCECGVVVSQQSLMKRRATRCSMQGQSAESSKITRELTQEHGAEGTTEPAMEATGKAANASESTEEPRNRARIAAALPEVMLPVLFFSLQIT